MILVMLIGQALLVENVHEVEVVCSSVQLHKLEATGEWRRPKLITLPLNMYSLLTTDHTDRVQFQYGSTTYHKR